MTEESVLLYLLPYLLFIMCVSVCVQMNEYIFYMLISACSFNMAKNRQLYSSILKMNSNLSLS